MCFVSRKGKRTTEGFREEACVLVGERRGDIWHARRHWPTRGEPASVSFDWHKVMAREEARRDVIGFFHTHPDCLPTPSARDDRTMQAWCSCFGKELLCVIESGMEMRAWIYSAENMDLRRAARVIRFKRNWLVAIEEN